MTAYSETKKLIAARDRMLRDAYHGRNGLSMTEQERLAYKAMMDRAKAARVRADLQRECVSLGLSESHADTLLSRNMEGR